MIDVNDESGFEPPIGATELLELATYVLDELRVHPQADLSILLVDEAHMEELHKEWMDLPGPTDVLSFPMDELRSAPVGVEPKPGMLGDIVVCPSVAARQALESGHATMEEILLLVTHGILHLLGYDHADEGEKAKMFELQRRLLLTFLARKPHDSGSGDIDDVAPVMGNE